MSTMERKTDSRERMKTSQLAAILFAFCMILATMTACDLFDDDDKDKDDPDNGGGGKSGQVEKAAIKYHTKYLATGIEMTIVNSFDSYYERERVDAFSTEGGMSMQIINLFLHPAKEQWTYMPFLGWSKPAYNDLRKYNNVPFEKGMTLEAHLKKAGYTQQGTKTVLGKECKVWVGKQIDELTKKQYNKKMGLWNDIPLYIEDDFEGGNISTATDYTFNVPAKAFDRATIEVDWIK